MTFSIGLVDDQLLFLHGIRAVIDSQPDLSVSWLAGNGEEALEAMSADSVDIVLMDIQMPVLDGIAATRQFSQRFPGAKVIILTTFDDEGYVMGALSAGGKRIPAQRCRTGHASKRDPHHSSRRCGDFAEGDETDRR